MRPKRFLEFQFLFITGILCTPAWGAQKEGEEKSVLAGQVFDQMGSGIRDMSVTLHRINDGVPVPDPVSRSTTTDFGDFELSIPPGAGGKFVVRMKKAGFAPIERPLEIRPGEALPFIDAQAVGDLRVEGRVWDRANESPISGARVMVTGGFSSFEAASDERGRFVVESVPPQPMRIQIEARGFATVARDCVPARGAEPIEFWLEPGWSAIVRIVDPLGNPMPQVHIEAMIPNQHRFLDAVTDEIGEAVFDGLDAGSDRIEMRFSHFALPASREHQHVLIRSGDESEVRRQFSVELGGRVRGRVTDAASAEPIYSARIMGGDQIVGAVPKAWSDWEGAYSLASLAPGRVVLTVHHADYAPALKELEVAPGQTLTADFALQAGRVITGRVVDEDGAPVPQAFVVVTEWRGHGTPGIRAITDEGGRFTFEHAPADRLGITVVAEGYEPETVTAGPDSETELRIELDAAVGVAEGKLARGDPAPDLSADTLAGVKLKLSELSGRVVLVDFWATWCGPCLGQMSHLKETYEKFGGREDFAMIGISLDHDRAAWRKYVEKEKLGWHQILDRPEAADSLAERYGIRGIPAHFLIDKNGKIAATAFGIPLAEDEIAALLK